ncbi:tRNA (cytosine(38)-C(5))-methyltransferase [Planococcus citri]|uniref:tRNA (cytosine(38)-C(5))-methyltransferase n=1 Tax=Planococcus citri TaxID=170843 RepID=UPI0031F99B15
MKVLELYSGIGGMHYALKGSTIGNQSEVIMAVEMNTACNEVYQHNFPKTMVVNRNVCSLSATEINKLGPNMILMSPPCQPFTRQGKQKDLEDNRNISLLQFIELLPNLVSLTYILLENVKGFEESETRKKLVAALRKAKFTYKEFLLNPRQFAICNSRLRYYLLAKRTSRTYEDAPNDVILDVPKEYENDLKMRLNSHVPSKIEEILQYKNTCAEWDSFLVTSKNVNKYYSAVDIITAEDENSCCFTGGYTRYLKGTGSLLTKLTKNELVQFQLKFCNDDVYRDRENSENNTLDFFKLLHLRYFTQKEVARLMTFPEQFSFPSHITEKQKYKMLSNSINVHVVSFLISYLMEYFPE